jgi:hypothetical protein
MAADSDFSSQLSGMRVAGRTPFGSTLGPIDLHSSLNYRWSVHQGANPKPLESGQVDYLVLFRLRAGFQKLQRQHGERIAAVSLDPAARKLLGALDRETSIRWGDLPDRVEGDWPESCRAAALLAGANLCEASTTRIRLTEYGDKLLAESSQPGQEHAKVAG